MGDISQEGNVQDHRYGKYKIVKKGYLQPFFICKMYK